MGSGKFFLCPAVLFLYLVSADAYLCRSIPIDEHALICGRWAGREAAWLVSIERFQETGEKAYRRTHNYFLGGEHYEYYIGS